MRDISIPFNSGVVESLRAGDECRLSGFLYSARDQAHARLVQLIENGLPLPVNLENQVIYYMGPAPTPPRAVIGSCGPTTASRMDPFTPQLLRKGVRGLIGKGPRNSAVAEALKLEQAVYFYAFGGCGALYSRKVTHVSPVAYPELGPEAIYGLTVSNFPVIVAMDSIGGSIFRLHS